MRKKIHVAALFLAALTLFAGPAFAWRQDLRYDVIDHPVPAAAQTMSLDDLSRNIVIAGAKRSWRFEPMGPGQLKATQTKGNHEAVLKISYSAKAYSITLIGTKNLDQEGDKIHPTYNHWVGNLETDIQNQLSIAGLEKK